MSLFQSISLRTRLVLGLFLGLSAIVSALIYFTSDITHPGMFVTVVLTLVGTAIAGRFAIVWLFNLIETADEKARKIDEAIAE